MKKIRRKKRSRTRTRRRPINVVASLMTTLNLYWGAASIFASISGNYVAAAYYIWAALLFDILDGSVARLTKSTSQFGKELDSLSDIVSFGVAPAVLIFTAYLQEGRADGVMAARIGSVVAIIFVICAALRLARYNVYQSERRDVFVGLPSPAAGTTVASFLLFTNYFKFEVAYWVLGPLTLGLAYLMVSTVPYPKQKFRMFLLAPRHAFRTLVLCVVGIAVFHYARMQSPALILFPMCATGVLYGIVNAVTTGVKRRFILGDSIDGRDEEPQEEERPQEEEPPPEEPPPPSKIGDVL